MLKARSKFGYDSNRWINSVLSCRAQISAEQGPRQGPAYCAAAWTAMPLAPDDFWAAVEPLLPPERPGRARESFVCVGALGRLVWQPVKTSVSRN